MARLTVLIVLCGLAFPIAAKSDDQHQPDKSWTSGGKQFWTDHLVHGAWRIQRNTYTGHYRLIDGENYRRTWGTFSKCKDKLDALKQELRLPPLKQEVVITLHGLGRTRESMSSIGKHLEGTGKYSWINVSYASTRGRISDHAKALASVIENLGEGRRVHFVAHSMGNLVVRHYLGDQNGAEHADSEETNSGQGSSGQPDADMSQESALQVGRIVMLAPPNDGSALADRFKDNEVYRVIFGVSGSQLTDQWPELRKRLATPTGEFGIIAGGNPNGLLSNPLVRGNDDMVVSVDETRLPGATDFIVVSALHTYIMNDAKVHEYTERFLEHGYFVSAEKRQPIPVRGEQ